MSDILLWQIFIRASIEFCTYQDCIKIYILLLQRFKTCVQVESNTVLHGSGIEDRHLVADLEKASAGGSRFERVGLQSFNGKWSNWLPVEIFFSCHPFDTLMHLWDKKHQNHQHRITLKTGSLSENVTKEDERVLFHPWDWKWFRRGWSSGHFDTSTDLLAPLLQFWQFFS